MGLAIDKAALEGTGLNGQPTGILNTTGVNTTTFAAANPTFAEIVAMETALRNDNVNSEGLAYILPSAINGALKTTEKASGTAQFVTDGRSMNGYRTVVSNQGTAGNVYLGDFSDLLIGMFGTLDLTVDPYSLSTTGSVRVVALQSVDTAVRHAQSFCVSNDGA
jgi:HK97 family phage major capsid protein